MESRETNADSSLGRLHDRLYSPKPVDGISTDPLAQYVPKKPESWKQSLEPELPGKKPSKYSATAIFLMFAAGFFVLAGITAAVVLFLGGRSVSSDHLSVSIQGPTTVSGGESVPLLITITNDNPLAVQGAVLELDFPEGAYTSEDASEPLLHVVEELGDIAPGASVRKTVRAAFFGEENKKLSIPITIQYRTDNSNATFVTRDSYDLVIATAPVTLTVENLSEVPAGQPVTLTLRVRSNAVARLENIAVRADYPFGFTAAETEPVARDGDLFVLGSLEPGQEERIVITGPLSGISGEERVFRFAVGSLRAADANEFGVAYASKDANVAITRSFLAVGMSVNRTEAETIVIRTGDLNDTLVSWENTLATAVQDGQISIAITGDAFDSGSVRTNGGFYRSSDRTVLFNGSNNSTLANLGPGASGSGSFSFSTKTGGAMNALRNPSITLSASVSGRRVGEDRVPETVTSTVVRVLKVATDLTLEPRVVRTVGPFDNTGPWPPVADQKTTYTVLMTARNTVNSVADGEVKTFLPPFVRFTGQANPVGAVVYNEGTREVTWTIGEMAPGASKDASFQIEFLPSTSQKGTSPALTGEFSISGFDRFVQQELTETYGQLNTQATQDPGYTIEKGSVK